MATVLITPSDLAPFASIDENKAQAMIDDATAMALRVAPCLTTTYDDDTLAAAKAILRAAVLRWNEAGSGAYQQIQNGPFMAGFQQAQRKSMFWPSEITALQDLCSDNAGRAFSVDTMPSDAMKYQTGHWKTPTEWVYDL